MNLNKGIYQFVKFSIVGVLNTLINLLVIYIFTEFFGIYYLISAVLAFIVAVTNSFILNKIWTFQENFRKNLHLKSIKFFIVSIISLIFNLFILYISVEYLKIWYIFAQIIAIIFNLIINFFGNKLWTFKK
jgi:putative flippase GtrA